MNTARLADVHRYSVRRADSALPGGEDIKRLQSSPATAEACGSPLPLPTDVLDLRQRDEATVRLLREAVGDCGDLRGRLDLLGQKCLLVASSGGHIAQLSWL